MMIKMIICVLPPKKNVSSKRWQIRTILHGTKTQTIFILTGEETSNILVSSVLGGNVLLFKRLVSSFRP